MSTDPWSRPSMSDLREVLESIGSKENPLNVRGAERLELCVPAEVKTSRGNIVSVMTREISRLGIGILHRGPLGEGEISLRMASDSREFEYRVVIEWCRPCDNGMFMSGGRFLNKTEE